MTHFPNYLIGGSRGGGKEGSQERREIRGTGASIIRAGEIVGLTRGEV